MCRKWLSSRPELMKRRIYKYRQVWLAERGAAGGDRMIQTTHRTVADERYIAAMELNPETCIYFDIETTGLKAETSHLYLIGYAVQKQPGSWEITQLFAEQTEDERRLLKAFSDICMRYRRSFILMETGSISRIWKQNTGSIRCRPHFAGWIQRISTEWSGLIKNFLGWKG